MTTLVSGIAIDGNGTKAEEKEYLFTSGYDGKVLVWEFFEKSGGKTSLAVSKFNWI